ncbi:5'/3'-nucleotidase SurE [Orbaceae bacterium ESL0727]|nr:5'/3'-nucleotidase SurE [Orbaceae bacterium ESL0727]
MSTKSVNRVLLVNDDGIDAPGIALLKNIAAQIANEVWVVAPIIDQSGVSCAVSLKAPFRVTKRSEREFAVYGTPADCTLFAIQYAMKDHLPDLVLSGINNGSNVGFETILSGTVGAAMMATTLGIPAIALSQLNHEDGSPTTWDASQHYAKSIIRQLLTLTLPQNICMNINFPSCDAKAVKGIKITKQGPADVSEFVITPTKDPENNDYFWFRAKRNTHTPGTVQELNAANNGYIAITPIGYDRTNHDCYLQLQQYFDQ